LVQTEEERKAKDKARHQTPEYKAKDKARRATPEAKAKAKNANDKYLSSEHGKAKKKARESTPEYKARKSELSKTPKYKAKKKVYQQSDQGKTKTKNYEARPEVKARRKRYAQSPEGKAKDKRYNESPKGILKKERKKIHANSPEGKAYFKAYRDDPVNKAKKHAKNISPEQKLKDKKLRDEYRQKVLSYYSKRLSKSNIPCCNCCGENFHPYFLALDHIAGKKQMDSEPELVKIGYSSKMKVNQLQKWIVDNNYPKGFQILCHNCNQAKGFYGKCPHEMK